MNSKEKIAWVKNVIREQAEISPDGSFYYALATVVDIEANGGIPDEAPILISKSDQWSIIQKLEKEGFIKAARLQDDKKGAWIEFGDNKENETKAYLILPDHTAELWVLWGQIMMLSQAYANNQTVDRSELNKLYLEIIGKAEKIIKHGSVGKFKEIYKRPFTSLATAEIEARAKKAENSLELIAGLLLQIAELNPPAEEISKKTKEHSKLIERVAAATKAISGEKIDLLKLSYEQVLFILKIIAGHLYSILEAVSTGFISTVDDDLNAKYVNLLDYAEKIFQREDFAEIKKSLPEYLPKHLYEDLDERDVWWEDAGGKTRMLNFQGDVEYAWIRTGQQTFPLPQWLIMFFSAINNSVTEHRKNKSIQWDHMMGNLKERKERGEFSFGDGGQDKNSPPKPDNFVITLKDREIRINDFILSKPHATGKNMAFFEYVYDNPDKLLKRSEMPEYVKEEISGKNFTKILNALGFKSQVLKAFIPKRGKSSLSFRKEVASNQLEKEGIKVDILVRELELANIRNNPK